MFIRNDKIFEFLETPQTLACFIMKCMMKLLRLFANLEYRAMVILTDLMVFLICTTAIRRGKELAISGWAGYRGAILLIQDMV